MSHSNVIHEYGTPCLGGTIGNGKLYLTFPYWGVQCVDIVSNQVVCTWHKATKDEQFTTPIAFSFEDENKWLVSGSNDGGLWLWQPHEVKLVKSKHHLKCVTKTKESILRVFCCNICQSWFIIVTNFGNILLLNPSSKLLIEASTIFNISRILNNDIVILDVKLHDTLLGKGKRANKNKKMSQISIMYKEKENENGFNLKMKIISAFVSNYQSSKSIITLSKEEAVETDKKGKKHKKDTNKSKNKSGKKNNKNKNKNAREKLHLSFDLSEFEYFNDEMNEMNEINDKELIIDYDWCVNNSMIVLVTDSKHGCRLHCLKNEQNGFYGKWQCDINDIDTLKQDRELYKKLINNNNLYSQSNSNILNTIRIKFIESQQFIVVGPSVKDRNTLALGCYNSGNGVLRNSSTICSLNGLNDVLIAPLIVEKDESGNELFDVFLVNSYQVVRFGINCVGKSLVDMVCTSLKKERMTKQIETQSFDKIMENNSNNNNKNNNWQNTIESMLKKKNISENNLVFIISVLLKLLESDKSNIAISKTLKKALVHPINDIFMRRMIQLIEAKDVKTLVEFLIFWLKEDGASNKNKNERKSDDNLNIVEQIELWLTIVVDTHLGTLSIENGNSKNNQLIENLQLVRNFVSNLEREVEMMTQCQAKIHNIFESLKYNAASRNHSKYGNRIAATSANNDSSFMSFRNKKQSAQNDNLPDYSIEYLQL